MAVGGCKTSYAVSHTSKGSGKRIECACLRKNLHSISKPVSLAQPDAFEATNLIIPEDLTDITGNEELAYDTIQDKTASLDLAMRSNTRNGVLHVLAHRCCHHGLLVCGAEHMVFGHVTKNAGRSSDTGSQLSVYVSRHAKSPCLFGLNPAIYIPDCLDDNEALKFILAHESALQAR